MKKLFLDDERFPTRALTLIEFDKELYQNGSEWMIVRNYDEFVNWIETEGLPDYISFDHDLADIKYDGRGKMSFSYYEKTGLDCAKWLVDYCIDNGFKLPNHQVHSANPVGKKNIQDYLRNAKKHLDI